MSILHVPAFKGVVLEGSADMQRPTELQECDSYMIGPRGELVAASDLTDYARAMDLQGAAAPWEWVAGVDVKAFTGTSRILAVGYGLNAAAARRFLLGYVHPSGSEGTNLTNVAAVNATLAVPDDIPMVTFVRYPFVIGTAQVNLLLICVAAREHVWDMATYPGLYAEWGYSDGVTPHVFQHSRIDNWDSLGTGPNGRFAGGTQAQPLYPYWIAAYNDHVFYAGFDNTPANKRGPNRLGFSQARNPLAYGDDNIAPSGDRDFSDTDAYTVGGAGEILRAGTSWNGKLALGTSEDLHFLEGTGRDYFAINFATGQRKSVHVLGPHGLIEGPDGVLYGVSKYGLWGYDGSPPDQVGRQLINPWTKSVGWWDLIWQDGSAAARGTAGPTNQDLVWTARVGREIWIGIPFCNASTGVGKGTDTVIVRYNVDTGGFARQVFTGKTILGARPLDGAADHDGRLGVPVATSDTANQIKRYARKSAVSDSPIMPAVLPKVTFGEYAPYGPNGVGTLRRLPLTLSWESASALPLAFSATLSVDQQDVATYKLSIRATAPSSPATGDLWLDTSGTDAVIGVANSSPLHAAAADFVLKQWDAPRAAWRHLPGAGGKGTRATIPLTFPGVRGTRIKLRLVCDTGTGRYQLEGLGQKPTALKESV
jgi:hypothetical protein